MDEAKGGWTGPSYSTQHTMAHIMMAAREGTCSQSIYPGMDKDAIHASVGVQPPAPGLHHPTLCSAASHGEPRYQLPLRERAEAWEATPVGYAKTAALAFPQRCQEK